MRKLATATVLILVVAACGGATASSTTTNAAPATTAEAGATATTASVADTTASAPETTTAPATSSGARFAITVVSLGVLGKVEVENIGDASGSLAGYWLCQRPSYFEFPDVELQPGEVASVSVGGDIFVPSPGAIAIEEVARIGPFNPENGEVGLYEGGDFSDADAIRSYVEWGNSGHGRSEVAVEAGIWPEGGFVPTTADTGAILATVIPAVDPTHWTSGG